MAGLETGDCPMSSNALKEHILHRLLLLPSLLILGSGLFLPLLPIIAAAMERREFAASWDLLWRVEFYTFKLATTVAFGTTAASTLIALLTNHLPPRVQSIVYFICLFPLGVHIAFRVFGVQYLLSPEGPLFLFFQFLGVPLDLSSILFTHWATTLGLIHWTFPVAVTLMVVAVSRLDSSLTDAALLLGATRSELARKVVLPQLYPSLALCGTIVFCLAYGSFITPAALGGVEDVTVTRLIGALLNEGRSHDASITALVALITPLAAFIGCLFIYAMLGRRIGELVVLGR